MDIVQTFYNRLATQYDKLFLDWQATTHEQAEIMDKIFKEQGFCKTAEILDCACGIGTQAIGLARLGYRVTASDISDAEIVEAKKRAAEANVAIRFEKADFRALNSAFTEKFDIVIAMDNALPHMLTREDLTLAVQSIADTLKDNGIFVGSIRDYDALLADKPPYSPPYVHNPGEGKRISFQTWDWRGDNYTLTQYIVDDEEELKVSKFDCEYRATRREELTERFLASGCKQVTWLFPDETGFYQPIIVARK